MRSSYHLITTLLVVLTACFTLGEDQMSWDNDWTASVKDSMLSRRSTNATGQDQSGDVQGRNYAVHEPIYSNDTDINTVIDHILNSRREGRHLSEYDQVYADGNIEEALMQGNDMMARNLIRDKLCILGLMSCDVEEKRPFYSTIYAQGPPPPVHQGGFAGGPYGPARPMPPPPPPSNNYNRRPLPSLNSFGPPRKVGYESPFIKPNYRPSGPFLEQSPDGISFNKPPPGAIIYGSNPPGPIFSGSSDNLPPYNFENPDKIGSSISHQNNFYSQQSSSAASSSTNLVVDNVSSSSASAANSLQQHVHHHFHHVEGADSAGAKLPTVSVPIGSGQNINTDFSALAQSSAAFAPIKNQGSFASSAAFNAGFNGASQGSLLSQAANGGIYKPIGNPGNSFQAGNGGVFEQGSEQGQNAFGQANFGQNSFGQNTYGQNNLGQNGIGQSVGGSYHTSNPEYFKKELHNVGGISTSLNGLSAGYGSQSKYSNGYDTSRQQFVDCQCVPYNQCPEGDRIGRKEDLILPIDPRNLGKDIEALSEESPANKTAPEEVESKLRMMDEDKKSVSITMKKRSRREAPEEETAEPSDLSLDAEGRFLGAISPLADVWRHFMMPTYGFSFGLPSPPSARPANAKMNVPPTQKPQFGSLGPNGLNLGLVDVKPLVSLQVSKTDVGDKMVKPSVSFHVTPNADLFQRVSQIFKGEPLSSIQSKYHHHKKFEGQRPAIDMGPSTFTGDEDNDVEIISSPAVFEHHIDPNVPQSSVPTNHHIPHHYPDPEFSFQQMSQYQPYPHGSPGQNHFNTDNVNYSPHFPGYDAGGNYPYNYKGRSFEEHSNAIDSSLFEVNQGKETDKVPKEYSFNSDYTHGYIRIPNQAPGAAEGGPSVSFPRNRRRRSVFGSEEMPEEEESVSHLVNLEQRAYYGNRPVEKTCRINEICCRRPYRPQPQFGRCGVRNAAGITGRIKNPDYVDGDSEFGEYPWHVAILKKDPKESIYACGGTLIDALHVITAAHCIKSQNGFDLRARLGEWDVNHDVEFYPYIERDIVSVHIHPEYYAGTLDNDLALLKLDHPVDFTQNPHISPACLPDKYSDFTGARCWTTGWGKDAFGANGKYQNILKEVDVPILSQQTCQNQLRQTRLGYGYNLNPGFICAGGEEGKDACKGDGGGPLVCERNGAWNVVGVVSWGIGCGQVNVPGVYVRVAHYLDWIRQLTQYYK